MKIDENIGKRFGKLTIIERDISKKPNFYYLCKCDCGKVKSIYKNSLIKGITKSCGCDRNKKDMIGKKFGKLTVLEERGRDKQKQYLYLCKCDCGNETIVRGYKLRQGRVKSCGKCLGNHFYDNEYIKNLYYKLKREDEEGKIVLCKEWKENPKLFNDYVIKNKNGSILKTTNADNIYSEKYCKWISYLDNYKKKNEDKLIKIDGKEYTLRQISREFNIKLQTLIYRKKKGYENEELLTCKRQVKAILQYDLNGNFIKKFNSIKDASDILGIKYDYIHNNLRKHTKECKGYVFKYLKED